MGDFVFKGLGVCSGIAFGKVHLVDRRRVAVPRYHLDVSKIEEELSRFERAIEISEQQLKEIKERAHRSDLKEVEMLLDAHTMVLRDEAIRDATRRRIVEYRMNAEWALKEELKEIRKMFDGLDVEYFRERRSDVDLVSDRVMRNLLGAQTDFLENIPEDAIVIAYDLSPADTVALARYSAKGFVTETGGKTSHTAIIAKAMNVPAVLGVHGLLEKAGTGDEIIVDGELGDVILEPSEKRIVAYQEHKQRRAREENALLADGMLPGVTLDGHSVELLGNIEVADEIEHVLSHGGEGIGLYRTEFLVIERHAMLSAEDHALEYAKVAGAMKGRQVTVRTIDLGGDKFVRNLAQRPSTNESSNDINPALGLRAIRISLKEIDTFRAQIRGILKASTQGNLRVLLPFVTQLEEVRKAKKILDEEMAFLTAKGISYDDDIPLGIMIETPAAVMIADQLASEVDFFSVGTNDLIQYSLAVDRANDDVAHLYRPSSPAVLRMLKMVCDVSISSKTPLCVCGEMASDPFHIPLLLGLGVRSLSMSAQSLPLIKRLIRRVTVSDCENLVQRAINMKTAEEVEHEVVAALKAWKKKESNQSNVIILE
ncbi:MAG: phosphoenolpyruvate--protein phosphotransferase [Myxococcota bacterium]|nr:phosphoenolpyruvate--protein phosphotransferase [Myxococcota bacterium]